MITHLAISGGGSSGIKFAGSLKYLEETNRLDNVQTILGTSIGAIIAVLLSFCTVDEIINNIKSVQGGLDLSNINLNLFISEYGFLSKKTFIKSIETILIKKFNKVLSFQELYDYSKKEIIISSFNLSKEKIMYFNYKTHPDMLVSTAISLSINIPFIFEKEVFNNDMYIDAGVVNNNISWEYFNDIPSDKKLGIYLYIEDKSRISNNAQIFEYYIYIFKSIYNQSVQLYEKSINLNNEHIFIIKEEITSFSDKLGVPNDKIFEMLKNGYEEMQIYLKKKV